MAAGIERAKKSQQAGVKPSFKRRLVKWTMGICAAVVLTPVLLTILYTVVNPVSTLMLGRYLSGETVERKFRPLSDISTNLQRAVVVSEDSQYCQHEGIDWLAIKAQLDNLFEGEKPRGASTITMQLAKNLFLWNDRDYARKALEAPLALLLDMVLSKRRIFEIYLNTVEWGEGVFGIEAATQKYFGKSAESLSKTQASLLATALPNPVIRNPSRPGSGHRRLASINRSRTQVAGTVLDCLNKPKQ
ncbi:monofunctional biosynthetic peptidoglycan transglycosylase [Flexibacterium corallicola]|uniref:monofunctional biosynthetic peptidoglycan transglycosylase n=1 Tax=Flexibacterium corallicola TaxID=3037259 RepID=UPI00286EE8A8|nr:monofunctional biosynthetic peptidoglycan transglycosylase [Pseudovibrio sp. M1P-2-3]